MANSNVTSGGYGRGPLVKPTPKRLLSEFVPPKRANNGTKVRRMNTGSAAPVKPKVKGSVQTWRGEKTPHKFLTVDGIANDQRWNKQGVPPIARNQPNKFRNRDN